MVTPFLIVSNHGILSSPSVEDVNECDSSWLINQVALEYIISIKGQRYCR